jgi:hypothetical protein
MSILSPGWNAVAVPIVTVTAEAAVKTRVSERSAGSTVELVAVLEARFTSLLRYKLTSAAAKTSPAVKVFLGILGSFVLGLVYQ